MSFDDYANYIKQKHCLSIAIAIIRSKPKNLSTDEYINKLKGKITDKMDDDFDFTIASDDFNIENDDIIISDSILKDIDLLNDTNNGKYLNFPSQTTYCEDITESTILHDNDATFFEYGNTEHDKNTDCSKTIAKNNNQMIDLAIAANMDHESAKTIATDHTKPNNMDVEHSIPKTVLNKDQNQTIDSQKTIIYTVPTFTQDYTHYSPSQTQMSIPSILIRGSDRYKKDTTVIGKEIVNPINSQVNNMEITITNINNAEVFNAEINKTTIKDATNVKTKTDVLNPNVGIIDNINDRMETEDNKRKHCDNFEKVNTDVLMEISQNIFSQEANIYASSIDVNDFNNIYGNNNYFNKNNISNQDIGADIAEFSKNKPNNEIFHTDGHTMNVYEIDIGSFSQSLNRASVNMDKYHNHITDIDITDETINKQFDSIDNNENSNNHSSYANDKSKLIHDTKKSIDTATDIKFTKDTEVISNINFKNDTEGTSDTNFKKDTEITPDIQFINDIERHSSDGDTEEAIPFKILGEFNKVKSLLNRDRRPGEDYSSDSGYRSDSQGKNSKNALQLTGTGSWLNQSGHSLFIYIIECHLLASTRDITNEIAEVLGQLIDKLHDEEKYPAFLEELLDTVNELLRRLHEGDNSIDDVLLKKDETIQRLILLNISKHMQKYCIEKITLILNNYHSNIVDKTTIIEVSNVDEIENSYYIFHILEILLQKYLKTKDLSSQASTQPSQEEGMLKKSTITDIWKRKWNPNYKNGDEKNGGAEKKCILTDCSEILNKLIVDSLNSYSLISYAALKCFNLMQS